MKRPLFITIGIVTLLLVVGLWVYLLIFGTPERPQDVFTNLGVMPVTTQEVRTVDTDAPVATNTQLALSGAPLQQVTTKAVAGFGFAATSSLVRYVERGTGHVYEIDVEKGTETQISVTTLPQTAEVVFSPNGSVVAVTSYRGYAKEVSVGTFTDENQLELTDLPLNAENIAFVDEETLYFSVSDNTHTLGYVYDVQTQRRSELFDIPLPDVHIQWDGPSGKIYVATKPTQYLEGFLYSLSNGVLTPMFNAQYGLTAFADGEVAAVSYIHDDAYTSDVLMQENSVPQSIIMVPEKCVATQVSTTLWCAAPVSTPDAAYLESWYKGEITSEDYLWRVQPEEGSAMLVADFLSLSGRIIDVSSMKVNPTETLLLLRNKTDQSLWLYRLAN